MKKIVLTAIKFSEIPVEAQPFLLLFDAVSLPFNEWKRVDKAKKNIFINERHAWEWASFINEAQAEVEGTRLGKLCAVYNIHTFYVNAEAEWAGVERFKHKNSPYKVMEIFIKYFRKYAPTKTKLAYNGFSWSRTSDGRLLHDRELLKNFDLWVPMLYDAVKETWKKKVAKYDMPRMPMIGVGRIDSEGKTWGEWDETIECLKDARIAVDGICFFFGNGAKKHFLQGHTLHPSLMVCVEQLRKLWDTE